MRWTILLVLGCAVAGAIAAAPAAAEVPVITLEPGRAAIASNGRFDVLHDAGATLTVDEIGAVAPERWRRSTKENPNDGFTRAAVWGRFDVVNPGPDEARRMIVFRYPLIDEVQLFVAQPGGGFTRTVNGDRLRYSQRPFASHLVVFEIVVPAGQARLVYFRIKSDSSMQFAFDVMTADRMRASESDTLFVHGAYYGLMLALGVYNLFLFLSIRTRAYLWYVVYVVVFTATQMGLDGTAGRYLFPEHPGFANTFTPLTIALLLNPPLLFAQEFLATKRNIPRVHRVVTGLIIVNIAPALIALFAPYGVGIRVATLVAMFCCVACLALGVLGIRKGYRPARFYVLAWTSVIVGTMLYAAVAFGLLPANVFFSNIQRIGSALEVVLLSFALGDHISTINAERDAARTAAIALERDMAVTGTVQRLFLPRQDTFEAPGLALRGFYAPAAQSGGDWWWYEPSGDGRVRVLLGDVTGHGVGAAMVTAGIAAAYRALPEAVRHGDVRTLIAALNDSMAGICAGAHHMTLGALEVDPGCGDARLWSAGAPAALIMRADGTIEELVAAGRPLGAPELQVGEARARVSAGDRIFVFSDGLHELVLTGGRQLGYRGVSRMLRKTLGRTGGDAYDAVARELGAALTATPQLDDIAFVLIDVTAAVAAEQVA